MSSITYKDNCTGCGACFNVCPKHAIRMLENNEGFLYPQIDETKCVNCGLCKKACPANNFETNNFTLPDFHSGSNSDENIRKKSSSGGIFSLLAEQIIKENGIVFGAVFDKNLYLHHTAADSIQGLEQMRGSKYLQSDTNVSFQKVKDYLKENKKVLYTGTPCQIAGLLNYLKVSNTKMENLLTMDLVCHGTPSPAVFKATVEKNRKKYGITDRIVNVVFRGKGKKYIPPEMYYYYYYEDGTVAYKNNLWKDSFGKAFGLNLILRKSCTNCKYSTFPRCADISIGDFWGIDKFNKSLNDNKGISIISINNPKGKAYFDKIKSCLSNCESVSFKAATNYNPNFYIPSTPHVNRNHFFENFNKQCNVEKLINESLSSNVKKDNSVAILCFTYDNKNYGANFVPFAMSCIVKELGYNPKVINFNPCLPPFGLKKKSVIGAIKFREQFIPMTIKFKNAAKFKDLNKYFDTFIVGSDQVWNLKNTRDYAEEYFLSFVETKKNIIAYAASFGSEEFNAPYKMRKRITKLLQRFDAISTREESGVGLIHKYFSPEIKCEAVLDPTLLVNINDYEDIIASEKFQLPSDNYIAYYMLSDKSGKKEKNYNSIIKLVKSLNLQTINIMCSDKEFAGKKIAVYSTYPQWLNYIKNAEFVITDSFHGVCFSIIFKKNFVYVNNVGGITRVQNILEKLGIKNRIFTNFEDINIEEIYNSKIDYSIVDENLKKLKIKSLEFLKNALDKSKDKEFMAAKQEKENIENRKKGIGDKFNKIIKTARSYFYFYKRLIKWGIYLYILPRNIKDKLSK